MQCVRACPLVDGGCGYGCTCTCVSVAIDLFHETDRFHFKPGYKNRRINITLLFGKRGTGYLEKNKK
jgi:hypothetical protein